MLWFKQFVVFLDKRMERIIVLEALIDIIVKHIEDLDDAEEGRIGIEKTLEALCRHADIGDICKPHKRRELRVCEGDDGDAEGSA